jgi:CelD/BcsL family acetyltransferase involved in cellulose biosynthesis
VEAGDRLENTPFKIVPPEIGMTPPSSERVLAVDATIVDPLKESTWDGWATVHPDATIFHTSAWARVLTDTYNHQPFYLRLSLQGEPLALIPVMEVRSFLTRTRGVCLPFSDFCAPLLFGNFGADLVAKKLRQIARERSWSYFEVRDASILPEGAVASESYWTHTLDLTISNAALIANFSDSVGRALRKAERSGLTATIRIDAAAMAEFYRLHVRTRRKHGAPPQPRAFFSNIQKHIIKAGLGFIIVVEKAQRAIASAIFFKSGSHVIYKFGASDERSQELRPNNLLMAQAISYLADSSATTLHFGRTDKTNDGLRRFKLSFGATEKTISYGKFSILGDTWSEMRRRQPSLSKRIFQALPAPANRLAGVLLYPHLD